jgi:hypothetical protein
MGQMSNQQNNYIYENQLIMNSKQFEKELEKIIILREYLKNRSLIFCSLFTIVHVS